MATVRFYLAVLMVVTVPPAMAFWFAAHPLVAFWRRVGPWVTYSALPELAPDRAPGKLLREGIYGRMRHPRYVSVFIGMIGFALLTNYSGTYVIAALVFPGLYGIAVLEERELLERFGEEYRRYGNEVPRFLPRRVS